MLFCPQNTDDISRYYRNTYVKFKEFNDDLFFIQTVERRRVTGLHQDGEEFELFYSDDRPYEVDYVIPHKSFFQYKNRACLLQRIPAKQYQRGMSSQNTQVISLSRTGGIGNMELSFDLLKAYVGKKEFPSFDKGVTSKGRMVSVALSPRFAYCPEARVIAVDTTMIAHVNHPDHQVVVYDKIFVPEIKELAAGSIFEVKLHGETN